MPSKSLNQELNHDISVSDLKYHVKCCNDSSLIIIEMLFLNNTHYNTELDYIIPYVSPHELISLSVLYKNQEKIALMHLSEFFPQVEFDDEVACGNFTIRLIQKDETTSILSLSNFQPSCSIKISIKILAQIFECFDHFSFTIPPIERLDQLLYPNYSILFQNFSEKLSFQNIQFEFNDQNHSTDIYDKTKIEASNISFQNPLILKFHQKTIKRNNLKSLNSQKDIVLFIDYIAIKKQKIVSHIINFLQNYGNNFSFNIILYGQYSNILFNDMRKKSSTTISQAEEFLRNPTQTNIILNFEKAYSEVFGSSYQNKSRSNVDDRFFNTIAVCIGSHESDKILSSKKVPIYLIDTIQSYNTQAFAIQNDLKYIGPITHEEDDLKIAFDNLLQIIKINPTESCNENQEFYDKIDQIYTKKSLNDLKNYLDSYNFDQNMSLEKLSFLIEKADEILILSNDDFIRFFEKFDLKDKYNDIIKMMNENNALFKIIKQLIIIYNFGNKLFDTIFDSKKISMKYFESIVKKPFISFYENNDLSNKNRFISSHAILKNEIKQNQTKEYSIKRKRANKQHSTSYFRDDQFYNNNKDNKKIKNKKLKSENKVVELSKNKSEITLSNTYNKNDELFSMDDKDWSNCFAAGIDDYDDDDDSGIDDELLKILESDDYKPQLHYDYANSDFNIRFG